MIQKKHIFLTIMLLIGICISAQDKLEDKKLYLRIYDMQGIKISKGKLVSIQENTIILKRRKKSYSIDVTEIGMIKSKRALGHNIGIGALAGASVGITYGFLQGGDGGAIGTSSGGDNAVVFGTLGLLAGPLIGGLSGLGKKSKKFEINKDPNQLRKFRELFSK